MTKLSASMTLAFHMVDAGFDYVLEHRFHPKRKWRFDFAMPDLMIAVEIEGGGWSGGRHTTGAGFAKDLEKYDAAHRLGWTVYRCSPDMVRKGVAIETIAILRGIQRGRLSSIAGEGAAAGTPEATSGNEN